MIRLRERSNVPDRIENELWAGLFRRLSEAHEKRVAIGRIQFRSHSQCQQSESLGIGHDIVLEHVGKFAGATLEGPPIVLIFVVLRHGLQPLVVGHLARCFAVDRRVDRATADPARLRRLVTFKLAAIFRQALACFGTQPLLTQGRQKGESAVADVPTLLVGIA